MVLAWLCFAKLCTLVQEEEVRLTLKQQRQHHTRPRRKRNKDSIIQKKSTAGWGMNVFAQTYLELLADWRRLIFTYSAVQNVWADLDRQTADAAKVVDRSNRSGQMSSRSSFSQRDRTLCYTMTFHIWFMGEHLDWKAESMLIRAVLGTVVI